jgi:predicted GNAT superfamily acetyltransferase
MTAAPQIEIRPCHGLAEFEACVALEKRVWESPDIEVVPSALFAVTPETGGQVLGAFDGERLIGFVLAFGACRNGAPGRPPQAYLHSHMTAVLPEYRDFGVGRNLKLFQRQEAISRGIDLVEWTFDPLELRNAYFNLMRLGAIVRRFVPNLYGITASPLHFGMPTDRFVAEWWLRSPRVDAIVSGGVPASSSGGTERIEVPTNIADVRLADREEAICVQTRIRKRVQRFFAHGFAVTGIEQGGEVTRYILEPASALAGVPAVSV